MRQKLFKKNLALFLAFVLIFLNISPLLSEATMQEAYKEALRINNTASVSESAILEENVAMNEAKEISFRLYSEIDDVVDATELEVADFIIEGDTIVAFSEVGKQKALANNKLIFKPLEAGSVNKIGARAFRDAGIGLEYVLIDEGFVSIGEHAFQELGITRLDINASDLLISDYAFADNNISTYNENAKISSIGAYAFYANSLVNLETSAKEIGENAFASNRLEEVILNEVTNIGADAFKDNVLDKLYINSESPSEDLFSKSLFDSNLAVKVYIKNNLNNIKSTNEVDYIVNPILVSLVLIDEATDGAIKENLEYHSESSFPVTIELEDIDAYDFVSVDNYLVNETNGVRSITIEKTNINNNAVEVIAKYLRKKSPSIIVLDSKQLDFPLNTSIDRNEILSNIKFYNSKGEEIPALENAELNKAITLSADTIEASEESKEEEITISIKDPYNGFIDKVNLKYTFADYNINATDEIIEGKGWTYEDFTYEGDRVLSFSEKGFEKLEDNKDVVLPDINPNTKELIKHIGYDYEVVEKMDNSDIESRISTFTFPAESIDTLDFSRMQALESIGFKAFSHYSIGVGITDLIGFEDLINLKKIDKSAFTYLRDTNVDFSKLDNLESIESGAFFNNIFEELHLDSLNSLNKIGNVAFSSRTIKSYRLSNLPNLTTLGETDLKVLEGEFVLENLPKLESLASFLVTGANIEKVILKDLPALKEIPEAAFSDNQISELEFVNVPNLEEIKNSAFANNKIEVVNFIAPKLKKIGPNAFENNNISEVDLAFYPELESLLGFNNNKISSINLQDLTKLKEIGANAFKDNPSLVNLNLSGLESLEVIGEDAFTATNIENLELINLPILSSLSGFSNTKIKTIVIDGLNKLETIGEKAFAYNENLTEVTLRNLPELKTIENSAFDQNSLWVSSSHTEKIQKLVLENLPKLELIGDQAFANNKISGELDFRTLPALQEIGQEAFADNEIASVIISGLDNLTTIGASAFARNKIADLRLENLPELTIIDSNAFGTNLLSSVHIENFPKLTTVSQGSFSNVGTLTEIVVKNNPKLESLAGFNNDDSYVNNFITKFELSNLPELNKIDYKAFYNLKIPNVDLTEFTKLTKIDSSAFESGILTELKLPTSIEEIGPKAFYNNLFKEIDLRAYTNLREIGREAFDYYNNNLTRAIAPISLPLTDEPITLESSVAKVKEEGLDFRSTPDVKIKIGSKTAFSLGGDPETRKPLVLKFDNDSQIEFDSGFNKNEYDPNPKDVLIIIIDKITDPSKFENLPNNVIINPTNITVNYKSNTGEKLLESKTYYAVEGTQVSPPLIAGYQVKRVDVSEGYKVTENTDTHELVLGDNGNSVGSVDFIYYDNESIKKDEYQISIKRTQFLDREFYYADHTLSVEAYYNLKDIDIENEKDVQLVIQLPEYASDDVIYDRELPGFKLKGEPYYNKDTRQLIYTVEKFDLENAEIKIKASFGYKNILTPDKNVGVAKAYYILKDGRVKGEPASSEEFVPRYKRWNSDKTVDAGNNVNGYEYLNSNPINDKYDDFKVSYFVRTFAPHINRELDKIIMVDTLPTYKKYADNELGYTIERAVFKQEDNEGWILSSDSSTATIEIPYTDIEPLLIDRDGAPRYYDNYISRNIVLEYPNAIEQEIINNANFTYYIKDPKDTEVAYFSTSANSNLRLHLRRRYSEGGISYDKSGENEFFVPNKEELEVPKIWTIDFSSATYHDTVEDTIKVIPSSNIEIWDYDLDKENGFLEYSAVTSERKATLYLYDKDFKKGESTAKEAREANTPIASIELEPNVKYTFTDEQISATKSLRLDYGDLILADANETLSLKVETRLKESKAGIRPIIDRTHYNSSKVYFVQDSQEFGISGKEGQASSQAYKNSGNLTKKLSVQKTVSKDFVTSRKDTFYYNLGMEASYSSSNGIDVGDKSFSIKDFELVDLFPEELDIVGIALDNRFEEMGGTYDIFDRNDKGSRIVFKAPSIKSDTRNIATIMVKPKRDANGDASIQNRAYIKHYEPETEAEYQIQHLNRSAIAEEGGKEFTAAVAYTHFQLNESLTANKYIRRSSKDGAWLKEIDTEPNEEFEYKLSIYNNFYSSKTNLALLDFFPEEGDINSVANNIGIREPRKSEFANKYLDFIKVRSINLDTNEETIYDLKDFPIILIKKNDDYPKRSDLGTQEDWVKKMLENPSVYQTTNPEEAIGIYVGGADTSILKEKSRLDLVFKMKTPNYSYDNWKEWDGKKAINNFSFIYKGAPRFAESDNVSNNLLAPRRTLIFKKIAKKEAENEEDKALAGARYKLIQGDNEYFAISSDEGLLYFRDIAYTDYKVVEVQAPIGYKIDTKAFEGTLDINTHSAYLEKKLENPNEVEIIHTFEDEKLDLEKANVITDLVIHKTNPNIGNLANVRFRLEKLEGENFVYIQELMTNKEGKILFPNLSFGQYRLTEVSNMNRFTLIDPVIFNLPLDDDFSNEQIASVSKQNVNDNPSHLEYTFNIINDKFILNVLKLGVEDLSFSLKDHEANTSVGKALADIQFDLYETSDTVENGTRVHSDTYAETKIAKYTTAKNGRFTLTNIKPNVIYKLDELTDLPEYTNKEDIFFYLDEKGILKTADGDLYRKKDLLVVTNKKSLQTSKLEVVKVDETGKALSGAKFRLLKLVGDTYQTLEAEDASPKKYTILTDEEGRANFGELEYGKYRIEELVAPTGYVKNNSFIDVTLEPFNSKIISRRIVNKAIKLNLNKVEKISGPYSSTALADLEFDKYKSTREDAKDLFVANNIIYKRLKGAELKLKEKYAGNSNVLEASFKETSSDAYSIFTFTDNINQSATYEVLETIVPEGYKKPAQNPIIKIDNILNYNNPSADVYIENTKASGSIIVNKFESEFLKVLAGAKFAIYEGHLTKEQLLTATPIKTMLTAADGSAVFNNLAFGKYTIKEIESPKGFTVLEDPVYVSLTEQVPNVRKSFYNNVETTTLKIKKVDDLSNPIKDLSASEFVLYYNNAKEIHSTGEISASEEGVIEFANVPTIGTYTIKEVKAPTGYVIDANGEYSFTKDATNPVDANEIAYTIKNKEQIKISASKVWKGGKVEARPNVYFKLFREFDLADKKVEEELDTAILEIGKVDKEVEFAGDFDKYYSDNGTIKEYKYFVKEVDEKSEPINLDKYNYRANEKSLNLINTYYPPKSELIITKKWLGGKFATKPDYKFELYRKTEFTELEKVEFDANVDLSVPSVDSLNIAAFDELLNKDKTLSEMLATKSIAIEETEDKNGNPYTFVLREINADGSLINENSIFVPVQNDIEVNRVSDFRYEVSISNKYNYIKKTDIEAQKIWIDKTEDTRTDIWFKLYKVGANKLPIEVKEAEIVKLPKGINIATWSEVVEVDEEGREFSFLVREVDENGKDFVPASYSKSENGLTVTNTLIPSGTGITTNPNKNVPNKPNNITKIPDPKKEEEVKEEKLSSLPKTSDKANISIYLILILLSSLSLVILGFNKKRN